MKKLVQVLALIVTMAFSVSLAQQRTYVEGRSNVTIDFTGSTSFSIFAAGGITNIAGPLGLRGGIQLGFVSGGGSQIGLGADAIFNFGSSRSATDPEFYAGGGIRLVVAGGTAFGINGVLGAEFPLNQRISVNAEFVPILFFGAGSNFGGNITVGFRFYL